MKLFINAYFHSETYMGDFVKQEEEQGLLMMERDIHAGLFFSSKGTIFQFAIYSFAILTKQCTTSMHVFC